MVDQVDNSVRRAGFRRMRDGTEADYALIEAAERAYFAKLPERVLGAVAALAAEGLDGYPVDRTEHSLQSATRALRDGRDTDYVVAALVHDIGDPLAPFSHGRLAASVLRPFVSARLFWIVEHHPVFQTHYYAPHLGVSGDERERYRGHPWFADTVEFCERYDENCFDADYPSLPLEHFAPMVREVFGRTPSFPEVPESGSAPASGQDTRSG
jgi:predicted HD phosphohydrolase